MPMPVDPALYEAYNEILSRFGGSEHVTGIDIGYRYVDGKRQEKLAVRVHVGESITYPFERLEQLVREVLGPRIHGVPVVVIPARYRAQAAPCDEGPSVRRATAFANPIRPGVSASRYGKTGGTLGLIVYDLESGAECALSCWHVFAGEGAADGSPTMQPGGQTHDFYTIGRLGRSVHVTSDAAISCLNGRRTVNRAQAGTDVVIESVRPAWVGDLVQKSGARTAVTCGLVDGCGRYYVSVGGDILKIDGFKVVPVLDGNPHEEEISRGGDSGAVWYGLHDHQGLGVHVAGEKEGAKPKFEHAIACHLDRALEALQVTVTPPSSRAHDPCPPTDAEIVARLAASVARLERLVEDLLALERARLTTEPRDRASPP